MNEIRFEWDHKKAIQATAYLVSRLRQVDKIKLIKLLYIADRDHFLEHGRPITGDTQCAMPWGPVPSKTLDLLDGDLPTSRECFRYLHRENVTFTLDLNPGQDMLSSTDVTILDKVLREHGSKRTWPLVEETEQYPEYKQVYEEGTSTPIPYEKILECYEEGDGSRFRHNRPVVSRGTIAAMRCPFPPWQ